MEQWISELTQDAMLRTLLLLVLADFVFGVLAALKSGVFRLSYVAAFAKDDVLGKIVPFGALYLFAQAQGDPELFIPGLSFGLLVDIVGGIIIAAFIGSILNSVRELFPTASLPNEVAGDEHQPVVATRPVPA